MNRRSFLISAMVGGGVLAQRQTVPQPRRPLKVVVVGDHRVGKTSMLTVLTGGRFARATDPLSTAVYSASVRTNAPDGRTAPGGPSEERRVLLSLHDTIGLEEYGRIRVLSYPDTDVVVIVFSIDSRASFERVQTFWHPEIQRHAASTPIVLIGNKIDLRRAREATQISSDDGVQRANSFSISNLAPCVYRECSALNGEGLGRPEPLTTDAFAAVPVVYSRMLSERG